MPRRGFLSTGSSTQNSRASPYFAWMGIDILSTGGSTGAIWQPLSSCRPLRYLWMRCLTPVEPDSPSAQRGPDDAPAKDAVEHKAYQHGTMLHGEATRYWDESRPTGYLPVPAARDVG